MSAEKQEPLSSVLDRCRRAITYTSTVGAEALIAGCISNPEGEGSVAFGIDRWSRAQWLHDLSWKQFRHEEYKDKNIAGWIMSGYDEARERAKDGLLEHPREKLDRNIDCLRYYKEFGN